MVFDATAQVKDMIYVRKDDPSGIPVGYKSTLAWNAVMEAETYLRKFVDDIISAILTMWLAHGKY